MGRLPDARVRRLRRRRVLLARTDPRPMSAKRFLAIEGRGGGYLSVLSPPWPLGLGAAHCSGRDLCRLSQGISLHKLLVCGVNSCPHHIGPTICKSYFFLTLHHSLQADHQLAGQAIAEVDLGRARGNLPVYPVQRLSGASR